MRFKRSEKPKNINNFFYVRKNPLVFNSKRPELPIPTNSVARNAILETSDITTSNNSLNIICEKGVTAQDLADQIYAKYNTKLNSLHSITLATEGNHQFAADLLQELRHRNFISKELTVRAMRAPELNPQANQVHIEYTTRDDGELLVSAWCYRGDNNKGREADKLYICSNTPYNQAFTSPQCAVREEPTIMSENVAIAITCLRDLINNTLSTEEGKKAAQSVINTLQTTPNVDDGKILFTLSKNGFSPIMFNIVNNALKEYRNEQQNKQSSQPSNFMIVRGAKAFCSFVQQYFMRVYYNNISTKSAPEDLKNLLNNVSESLNDYRSAEKKDKPLIVTKINENINELRAHLIKEIETYLENNPEDPNSKSVLSQKRGLMRYFKDYLENPSTQKLNKITRIVTGNNTAYKQWNQSWTFSSRVQEMQLKFDKFRQEEGLVEQNIDEKDKQSALKTPGSK